MFTLSLCHYEYYEYVTIHKLAGHEANGIWDILWDKSGTTKNRTKKVLQAYNYINCQL